MIIMPPEEIKRYISVDENGNWIYDPEMPKELVTIFNDFVESVIKAKEYRMD